MKKTVILVAFVSLFSCNQKIEKSDISKLNGYWEIEKVTFADGNHKEYKINETIDFFEIKNDSGFRKKVTPQFNGKYLVNDQSEKVKVVFKNDKAYLDYSTPYQKYEEEIIAISDKNLVLKNSQDVEYDYKKPIPFSVK